MTQNAEAAEGTIRIGDPVPTAALPSSEGRDISLADYRGRMVALFFYPQDLTPTCTQEACDFRDYTAEFAAAGAQVIGVSPDEVDKHDRFIAKHELNYPLVSDPEHKWIEPFGIWAMKKLYGREYMGLVRSTFLIGEDGILLCEWRNIKVKNHVERVLEAVRKHQAESGGAAASGGKGKTAAKGRKK